MCGLVGSSRAPDQSAHARGDSGGRWRAARPPRRRAAQPSLVRAAPVRPEAPRARLYNLTGSQNRAHRTGAPAPRARSTPLACSGGGAQFAKRSRRRSFMHALVVRRTPRLSNRGARGTLSCDRPVNTRKNLAELASPLRIHLLHKSDAPLQVRAIGGVSIAVVRGGPVTPAIV